MQLTRESLGEEHLCSAACGAPSVTITGNAASHGGENGQDQL